MNNFIEILGWLSTALVLCGFYFNSKNRRHLAFVTWIMGDVGWIVYDVYIDNWSHMALSLIIIFLNLYGIYNNFKHDNQGIPETNQ